MSTVRWGRQQSGFGFVAAASSLASGAIASGTLAGASWAAIAIPIIGPAIVGITMGISAMLARRGRQKVMATQIVDEVEPYMASNRDAYLSGPRNASAQAQALANFDSMWADVVRACSDPQLGSAGGRCISDRQPGGKWDWFGYYRDPIANDTPSPDALIDTGTIGGVLAPVTDALASSPYRTYLPLVAAALIMAGVVGGSKR